MLTEKLSSSTKDLFTSMLLGGIRTHVKESLTRNGYPDWLIKVASKCSVPLLDHLAR